MKPRAQRRHEAEQRALAGAGLTLSAHARTRATELGFSVQEIVSCVQSPEQVYGCHPGYGPGRRTYRRGELAVIVAEATGTVLTVLLRRQQQWTHGADRHRHAA